MSHRSRRFALVLPGVILLSAGLFLGCKPKPGAKCTGSSASCMNAAEALVCIDSVLTSISCRGPSGCTSNAGSVECDNSLAVVDEGCITQGDIACATDKKAALECNQHKFRVIETCKASRGCEVKDSKISCDNNLADVGDPCHRNGDFACTVDKQFVAKCNNNKFEPITSCRGPKACKVYELPEENRVEFSCDDTMAKDGDPCDTNGEYACSMDQKSIFACQGNKYVLEKQCPGGCNYDEHDHSLSCQQAGGEKTVMAKTIKTGSAGSGSGSGAKPAAAKPAAAAHGSAPAGAGALPAGSAVAGAAAKPGAAASVASAAKPAGAAGAATLAVAAGKPGAKPAGATPASAKKK